MPHARNQHQGMYWVHHMWIMLRCTCCLVQVDPHRAKRTPCCFALFSIQTHFCSLRAHNPLRNISISLIIRGDEVLAQSNCVLHIFWKQQIQNSAIWNLDWRESTKQSRWPHCISHRIYQDSECNKLQNFGALFLARLACADPKWTCLQQVRLLPQ